jgi:hypothetical protein
MAVKWRRRMRRIGERGYIPLKAAKAVKAIAVARSNSRPSGFA